MPRGRGSTSRLPENEAVLAYLESERVAAPETSSAWVIDGYSLSTHPDLCDRVKEVNEAAGEPAELRYLYGKPALIAGNGVIVAFAGGTYVFCVRLPRREIDPRLVGERREIRLGHHDRVVRHLDGQAGGAVVDGQLHPVLHSLRSMSSTPLATRSDRGRKQSTNRRVGDLLLGWDNAGPCHLHKSPSSLPRSWSPVRRGQRVACELRRLTRPSCQRPVLQAQK